MASTATLWVLAASLVFFTEAANELARGWGDEINWVTLDEAWEQSKEDGKPVMLLIHKSWCGACKAFKPRFAASAEIQKMSNDFIMVNVEDNEEPSGEIYRPDGGYIPRILFFEKEGKLLNDVYNKNGNKQYMYYYSSPDQLVDSMQTVAQKMGSKKKKKEL